MSKINKISFAALVSLCAYAITLTLGCNPEEPVVDDQGNPFAAIVVPVDAPESLMEAAVELQSCITESTGFELPLRRDDELSVGPVISLGSTTSLQEASLNTADFTGDAFRIKTQGGNLYIYGVDTPSGEVTVTGGVSRGTANGVYSFLEKEMDVRWLMPGLIGRDVPQQETLDIGEIDRSEQPVFILRSLPYTQDTADTRRWLRQNKMGGVFHIEMGHNWTQTVTPDMFNQHPEWFPLQNGERVRPRGHYKLEVTNPELVQYFADTAIKTLKKAPARNTYSLSASDYPDGWSESEESRALYETDPDGRVSVTPLIVDFYRNVSSIVAEDYPAGKLAGYIYSNFLFPPQGENERFPDNFYPVLAPSINYSYKLYSPQVRERFDMILREWSELSDNLFYYDLPNIFPFVRGSFIAPSGAEILNYLFPKLKDAGVKGVYIYGNNDWAYGGMVNYMLAKLIWDPTLDATELQAEWLHRAYGSAAGEKVNTLYKSLDRWFSESLNSADLVTEQTIVDDVYDYFSQKNINAIYVEHLPAIHEMIVAAEKEPMNAAQRKRFNLLSNNVKVLGWKLQKEGLLEQDRSLLEVSDDEAFGLIFANEDESFDRFPTLADRGPMLPRVNVKLGEPQAGAAFPAPAIRVRNRSLILLYALEDGLATITPEIVGVSRSFASYTVKDESNKVIQAGELKAGGKITFDAQKGGIYFLYIPRTPPVYFELSFDGLAAAYKTDFYYNRLNLLYKPATLYVNVTQPSWQMSLQTVAPKQTCRVNVFNPAGELVGTLETGAQAALKETFQGEPGIWRVDVEKGGGGVFNDVFLTFDRGVFRWASVDGKHPLIISPK